MLRKVLSIVFTLIIVSIVIIVIFDVNKNSKSEINKDINETSYDSFKNTTNFKIENLDRYISYKDKNSDMSYEDVVTYVNIGLDYSFYDFVSNANTDLGVLLLTNKYLKLDSSYEPSDLEEIDGKYFIDGNSNVRLLRKEAKEAFEKLSSDSILNGTPVYGQSGYRYYRRQEELFDIAVKNDGYEIAINDTAKPGHSEHQTGLTIDVSSTKSGNMLEFENTKSFDWMVNNAHKYGFILRYPKDKSHITGFVYESWHYRYVGIKVATDMHDNYPDLTYEEYFYKYLDK